MKKRRYVHIYPEFKRQYVSIRFMAGDSFETIARSNPWFTATSAIEDIFRDQVQGERYGKRLR